MKSIAILLTVFNRKEKTLKCLRHLFNQCPIEGYKIDVYLVEDCCTDGTPEAVAHEFPTVHIIHGNGKLFWNRGMYKAWAVASQSNDYDFYIWLNDDTYLFSEAISLLTEASQQTDFSAIIAASIRSEIEEKITYGGLSASGLITPNGQLQPAKTFNGNCVLIPRTVFRIIGNLDWAYRHAIGDYDYGLRACKAGVKIYASAQFLGTCNNNPKLPPWTRKEVSFRKRIKNLYSPLGYAEPVPFFRFELRNYGLVTALKHFITAHIRVCLPRLWK